MIEFTSATADIQGDYRYKLTRVWNPALPIMTFVLLNPSTADATELDPTLQRCVGFARRDGFGGMLILNLYAFRTPYPKVLKTALDPVGPENDRALSEATGTVVAGWGSNADPARVVQAIALLPALHALGETKHGQPRHPLYVAADAPIGKWTR